MIEIKNLTFAYQGRDKPTLRDLNLMVKKREFVLLTGPTGCGKTTLLKALNGLIPHESTGIMEGSVIVAGNDTKRYPMRELTQKVGLVFQSPDDQIFSTKVEDEVAFGPENLCFQQEDIERSIDYALKAVGLSEFRNRATASLSGGEKQRLAIASVLAMHPQVLALDEPFSQMDGKGTKEVLEVIRKLNRDGMTIILVEHRIPAVFRLVSRIVIMEGGRIVLDEDKEKACMRQDIFRRLGLWFPKGSGLDELLPKFLFACPKHFLINLRLASGDSKTRLPGSSSWNRKSSTSIRFISKKRFDDDSKKSLFGQQPVDIGQQEHNEKSVCNGVNCPVSKPDPTIVLEAKDIYFRYEKKDGFVLQGASLQIRRGEIVALLGDNGTGKSTLLLHFAAILKPEKGMVEILGKDSRNLNSVKLAGKVGVVFQNPNLMLFRNTVNEEVEFGPRALKFSSHKLSGLVSETLKALAISNLRDEIPLSLSNGQRLRVATASIASMQPEIFLLDEPTQGQDRVHVESLMNYLKMKSSEGAALLFITHNLDVALRYADRILFMNGGRIVENV